MTIRFAAAALISALLAGVPLVFAQNESGNLTWDQRVSEGNRRWAEGRYTEAETIHRAALEEARTFPPDDPRLPKIQNNLAAVCIELGRREEAEQLLKEAAGHWERIQGPAGWDTATTWNNIGELYRLLGRFAEAEPMYLKSLAVRESVLAAKYPELAQGGDGYAKPFSGDRTVPLHVSTSLNNLAEMYRAQARFAEAEPLYLRSMRIREHVAGPESAEFGSALNNIAVMYFERGQFEESEAAHLRALSIREKALGSDSPQLAVTLNNLATLYLSRDRFEDASHYAERSVAILEQQTPESPNFAASLNNLADVYRQQRRFDLAEPLYRRSRTIWEKHRPPEHLDLAVVDQNLGELFKSQGKFSGAEWLFRRALATREKLLGPDHLQVAQTLHSLAQVCHAQGRLTEAEPLYRRALQIRETQYGKEHLTVAFTLRDMAELYAAQRRIDRAEPIYERALAVFKQQLGTRHKAFLTLMSNYANALRMLNQKEHAKAVENTIRSLR
jgi:tetratricopeptide (TPR) repeat protein